MKNSQASPIGEVPTFTGTEVGYYFICKKKLWWFAHGVQMEQESDRVADGEAGARGILTRAGVRS
ncbi:MAG: Dna2/Cas4 domain-containing protein [Pyrinomonadaceae bacterium]